MNNFLKDPYDNLIHYRYIPRGNINIVFFPGFMSSMNTPRSQHIETFCVNNSYSFLTLDYYGHGISAGSSTDVTISMCKGSAITVLNLLPKDALLLFVGSSMGSWIMHLISPLYSNRIIGMVGFANAPDFTKYLMWDCFSLEIKNQILYTGLWLSPYYPITLKLIKDGFMNLILKKRFIFKFPTILLHGLEDNMVPFEYTNLLAKCHKNQNLVTSNFIESTNHSFNSESELKAVSDSIQKIIINYKALG